MKPCVSVICKPQDGNTLLIKENTDKVSIFLCFAYLGPIIFFFNSDSILSRDSQGYGDSCFFVKFHFSLHVNQYKERIF